MVLECFQWGRVHSLCGQPVPVFCSKMRVICAGCAWSAYAILFTEQHSYGFVGGFFFLGPDLTHSAPSHENCLLFILCTCCLNQLLSAYDCTAVSIFHCAVCGRNAFVKYLYVFALNRSIKVPGPWGPAAFALLGAFVASGAPQAAPVGGSPSRRTWSWRGSWSRGRPSTGVGLWLWPLWRMRWQGWRVAVAVG